MPYPARGSATTCWHSDRFVPLQLDMPPAREEDLLATRRVTRRVAFSRRTDAHWDTAMDRCGQQTYRYGCRWRAPTLSRAMMYCLAGAMNDRCWAISSGFAATHGRARPLPAHLLRILQDRGFQPSKPHGIGALATISLPQACHAITADCSRRSCLSKVAINNDGRGFGLRLSSREHHIHHRTGAVVRAFQVDIDDAVELLVGHFPEL